MSQLGMATGMQIIKIPGCEASFDGEFITIHHTGNVFTNRQVRKEITLHDSEVTSVDVTPARPADTTT